jgi:hypothetical protein
MKRIKKKMSFYKLTNKKMTAVKGGEGYCGCACAYVNCGGSSTDANYKANRLGDLWSTGPGCAEQ